jgi:hypothetical protein
MMKNAITDEYEFPDGIDESLKVLVLVANLGSAAGGLEMLLENTISVWVKGVQFSGRLIGDNESREGNFKLIDKTYRKIIDQLEEELKTKVPQGMTREEMEERLKDLRSRLAQGSSMLAGSFKDAPPPKSYDTLSLKAVSVRAQDGKVERYEMVRIRLDQVDAFAFGEPNNS